MGRTRAALKHKLSVGCAVDISGYEREGDLYVFPEPPGNDMDYVDAVDCTWVWCIARRLKDNKIIASVRPSAPTTSKGWRELRLKGAPSFVDWHGVPGYQVLWAR
jgi:hypothetical protein